MNASTGCACLLLTGSVPLGGVPVNRTLAVTLPRACNSMAVPLQCKDASAQLPAPAPGPVATSAASPAMPPLRKKLHSPHQLSLSLLMSLLILTDEASLMMLSNLHPQWRRRRRREPPWRPHRRGARARGRRGRRWRPALPGETVLMCLRCSQRSSQLEPCWFELSRTRIQRCCCNTCLLLACVLCACLVVGECTLALCIHILLVVISNNNIWIVDYTVGA